MVQRSAAFEIHGGSGGAGGALTLAIDQLDGRDAIAIGSIRGSEVNMVRFEEVRPGTSDGAMQDHIRSDEPHIDQ